MSEYLSVQEARERILRNLQPAGEEILSLFNCAGRILAQTITATEDFPAFANSSMDGYAVISADVSAASQQSPIQLKVIADIPAGSTPTKSIQSGQAARIMTGAMVPDGADAVIPVEDTGYAPHLTGDQAGSPLPDSVLIFSTAASGMNIRPRGLDIRKGQVLLEPGRRLLAQDVGLLAATGYDSVKVFRQPVIALFSSGDELVQPGQPLQGGQIYDSNQYVLATLLEQAGARVLRLGIAPDNPLQIRKLIQQAVEQQADLIVTSAGVSVGAFDFIRQVIESNGNLDFWKVNMRPGKPLAYGNYAGIPFIGLPGNPVSAYVGCRVFVLPAVYRLAGKQSLSQLRGKALLAEAIESDGRESYLRAFVQEKDGIFLAHLTGHQGSGNLYSLVQANALLIVPSGVKSLPSDSEVDVWFFDAG